MTKKLEARAKETGLLVSVDPAQDRIVADMTDAHGIHRHGEYTMAETLELGNGDVVKGMKVIRDAVTGATPGPAFNKTLPKLPVA